MKTKTISAVKTYPVQQFIFDKIGLEDIFPAEMDDKLCIKELHSRIDAMAKEVYPWLFVNGSSIKATIPYGMAENNIEIPVTTPRQDPEPEEDFSLLDKINNSTTEQELKSWELLIRLEKSKAKKDELKEAYDLKMDKLTKSNIGI
jgi:hypothetical protein